MIKIFTVLLLLLGLTACNQDSALKPNDEAKTVETTEQSDNTETKAEIAEIKGTIIYLSFEGGFWGVETHNGKKLLPMNLPKAYQEEDIEVVVEGKVLEGVMTIHQWGTPFEISEIKHLEGN